MSKILQSWQNIGIGFMRNNSVLQLFCQYHVDGNHRFSMSRASLIQASYTTCPRLYKNWFKFQSSWNDTHQIDHVLKATLHSPNANPLIFFTPVEVKFGSLPVRTDYRVVLNERIGALCIEI